LIGRLRFAEARENEERRNKEREEGGRKANRSSILASKG